MSTPRDPLKAVAFIYESAPKYAEAKSQRVALENFLKTKRALLMTASSASSAAMKETEALAHPEYQELVKGLAVAVEREETLKWQMTAAELAVEVYRTESANNRRVDRAAT